MTNFRLVYEVEYTRKVGGTGTIIVRAKNEKMALINAKELCFTGSDFRNANETKKEYAKPRKQGFAGRN